MFEKALRHDRPRPRGVALLKTKAGPAPLPPSLGGWLTDRRKPPGRTSVQFV